MFFKIDSTPSEVGLLKPELSGISRKELGNTGFTNRPRCFAGFEDEKANPALFAKV
jgi:hypothetical protein